MLTELAMMPELFDEECHAGDPAWREHLRELGRRLFPYNSASSVILSDLINGSWSIEAVNIIKGIKNQNLRIDAEKLLGKIKDILVKRPQINDNWPDCEEEWAKEALSSSRQEKIAKIVVNDSVCELLNKTDEQLTSLQGLLEDEIWKEATPVKHLHQVIRHQVQSLRSICIHAGFIAFASPYIYSGNDGEEEFVLELIRSAMHRPSGFQKARFDVITALSKTADEQATRKEGIKRQLMKINKNGGEIRLKFMPKFLDRILIAGDATVVNGRIEPYRPRWGITFNHIARRIDPPEATTTWSLMHKEATYSYFSEFFNSCVSEDC